MSFPVQDTKKSPKMSALELPRQVQIRLPTIKIGLLERKTRAEIGQDCHVSEKTIRRDIETWTKTSDFLNWIRQVWLDKYQKVDDVEVFRQATKILIRTIPQEAEFRDVKEIREIKLLWLRDERNPTDQLQTS